MARQEISKDISDLVSKGKMREAYAKFEELPLVDQVAISISPGVGDALAAYETFEFGKRSETEFKEGDILGGLGYAGLSGISAISILPLFRLLRGARPVKEVFTGTKAVPEVVEEVKEVPIKLEEPKVPKADIPKLPKLEDINIRSLEYPNTGGLISNTRRELYTGNYPDQMKMGSFINKIRNKVPDSELRALKVLTPEGDLHPEFIQRFGSINDKINIKGFDDYLASNQKDVFSFFEEFESPISPSTLRSDNAPFVGTGQNDIIYTSKFTDAHKGGRVSEHYNADYPNVFVFDSATNMASKKINDQVKLMTSDKLMSKMSLTEGKTLKELTSSEKEVYNSITQELESLGLNKAEQDRAIAKIYRDPEFDKNLPLFENRDAILNSFDNNKLINFDPNKLVLNLNRIQSDYAEDVARLRTKLRRSDPKASPYEEPSVTKKVKELVSKYNDKVAEYNDYMIKGGIDAVPKNINDEISDILLDDIPYGYKLNYTFPGNKEVKPAVNQMLRKAYDGYRKKIRKGDIKPQSFLRFIKNDQNLKNNPAFDIKLDGKNRHILKPVRGFETTLYKMDPFATKGRAVVSKIVMRKRIEQAVKGGYGGIYMDSGRKVTSREGGAGQDIIETQYKEAESELKKIIRELGLNPDDVKTLDFEGGDELLRSGFGDYSGTYFPFSEEFKQAVLEKGINAFKKGGIVSNDSIERALQEIS